MKRTWVFILLITAASCLFAEELYDRTLYLEGSALRSDHMRFFYDHFKMDAETLGIPLVNSRHEAAYIFKFDVAANLILYDDGTYELAGLEDKRFVLEISLINNEDDEELISFGYLFNDVEEMYEVAQFLFFRAVVYLPPAVFLVDSTESAEAIMLGLPPVSESIPSSTDDNWQNKLLYIRASLGFPITFYNLRPDGLIGGIGIYDGSFASPSRVAPLDNKVMFLPAVTVGLELQFFDFMSLEVNFQAGWEHLNDQDLLNMEAGVELKVPMKFIKNVVISPYASFSAPLPNPISLTPSALGSVYYEENIQSIFAIGGGVQLGLKGGASGSIIVDINFKYSLGDSIMNNHYGYLYPKPVQIHYRRSVIGIGVGYKFGIVNRHDS